MGDICGMNCLDYSEDIRERLANSGIAVKGGNNLSLVDDAITLWIFGVAYGSYQAAGMLQENCSVYLCQQQPGLACPDPFPDCPPVAELKDYHLDVAVELIYDGLRGVDDGVAYTRTSIRAFLNNLPEGGVGTTSRLDGTSINIKLKSSMVYSSTIISLSDQTYNDVKYSFIKFPLTNGNSIYATILSDDNGAFCSIYKEIDESITGFISYYIKTETPDSTPLPKLKLNFETYGIVFDRFIIRGNQSTQDPIPQLLTKLDLNNDGKISNTEFDKFIKNNSQVLNKFIKNKSQVLNKFIKNKSQAINKKECYCNDSNDWRQCFNDIRNTQRGRSDNTSSECYCPGSNDDCNVCYNTIINTQRGRID